MIRSMTGFGRSEKEGSLGKVIVEITSTNRRYLEILFNFSRELASLENRYKEMANKYVKRGRIQIHIDYQLSSEKTDFYIDIELAKKYAEALRVLSEELGLKEQISLKDILAHKDILTFDRPALENDEIASFIEEALVEALEDLSGMREREGAALIEDISKRLKMIEIKIKEIQSLAPLAVQRYQVKLRKKVADLILDLPDNEDRIVREVAIMAERMDVTEEIVRFLSHIQQFLGAFDGEEAVGRLMDFLIQEMGREINTTASKSNDLEISRLTVEIRNELDKIREQIQNIE